MIALPADANENKSNLFAASQVHRNFASANNDNTTLHFHSEPDESDTRAESHLGARWSVNGRKKTVFSSCTKVVNSAIHQKVKFKLMPEHASQQLLKVGASKQVCHRGEHPH